MVAALRELKCEITLTISASLSTEQSGADTSPSESHYSTIAAPIGLVFMKFDIGDVYENLSRTTNLVKIGQKYRAIYMNT
jgi:hypothetical protein